MRYSFELVDNRHLDPHADDSGVSIVHDAPLTDEGRKEMAYRVDVWCAAVQSFMFADESILTTDGVFRVLKEWHLVTPGDSAFRRDTVCCYLYDAWFGDSAYEGLFKMLEMFNIVTRVGRSTSITGLHERTIIRVVID